MRQPAFKSLPNKVEKKKEKKDSKFLSTKHTGIFDQTFFHSIIHPAPETAGPLKKQKYKFDLQGPNISTTPITAAER